MKKSAGASLGALAIALACAIGSVLVQPSLACAEEGIDREEEEKLLQAVSAQSRIACGAPGRSAARYSISGAVMERIRSRMRALGGEIRRLGAPLDAANTPKADMRAREARMEADLAAARADYKSKQRDYDTALMYRKYATVDVSKHRAELAESRARIRKLEDFRRGGDRAIASIPSDIAARSGRATEGLSALAELSDRYEKLYEQTAYCLWLAGGSRGEPVPSIIPEQNYAMPAQSSGSTPAASQGGPAK